MGLGVAEREDDKTQGWGKNLIVLRAILLEVSLWQAKEQLADGGTHSEENLDKAPRRSITISKVHYTI